MNSNSWNVADTLEHSLACPHDLTLSQCQLDFLQKLLKIIKKYQQQQKKKKLPRDNQKYFQSSKCMLK